MKSTILIAAVALCPVILFSQGALTPPGAPAPTMKTLQQVEPRIDLLTVEDDPAIAYSLFDIKEPGSYYLTADYVVPSGTSTNGIQVSVSNVTIDLNGFTIKKEGNTDTAIAIASGVDNVTVHGGTIEGWGSGVYGIGLVNNCSVENVTFLDVGQAVRLGNRSRVRNCVCKAGLYYRDDGIFVNNESIVENCQVSGFFDNSCGIVAGDFCIIKDCIVFSNSAGISAGNFANVSNCLVYLSLNPGSSQGGIAVGNASSVSYCVTNHNYNYGIKAGNNSIVDTCTSDNDYHNGIYVLDNSIVKHSTVKGLIDGIIGIYARDYSQVLSCTVSGNLVNNGIETRIFTKVADCIASANTSGLSPSTYNQGVGIKVHDKCEITSCHTAGNSGDGIQTNSGCLVKDCVSDENGGRTDATLDGAGIHAVSYDNVIDSNTVYGNLRGIDVDSINSLIIRNRARTNGTNYTIGGTNRIGTIVITPSSGPVNGSAGGGGVGSTDPWANFSY